MEPQKNRTPSLPPLQVSATGNGALVKQFTRSFHIGRAEECDVCISNEYVSRDHAEVYFKGDAWWIRNLSTSNGTYIGEQRIDCVSILQTTVIRLGVYGPELTLEVLKPEKKEVPTAPHDAIVSRYAQHYFGGSDGETAGEHTMYIRKAYTQVQKKQKRKYSQIIAVLAAIALCAGLFGLYEHLQVKKQKAMARDLFYAMKSQDLDIASLRQSVEATNNQQGIATIHKFEDHRAEMEKGYDQFLATLHVYSPKLSERERIVLRVARIFGECELDMPPDFMAEVNNYIKYWQSSGRLKNAIAVAQANGYTGKISQEMLAQGLPPQFFYLALQESGFDQYASGPPTRKGIAKGVWQFIPETAVKYGLHLGPLVDLRRPDPGDDRHHFDRETPAAGKYLNDLYSTDAQASGLLVMACYNWGEIQVLPLVRSMPLNPKDRNFWQLLARHKDKIPKETYDYVFYIFSAAVIGENPRLFGFDFDNPLADLEHK